MSKCNRKCNLRTTDTHAVLDAVLQSDAAARTMRGVPKHIVFQIVFVMFTARKFSIMVLMLYVAVYMSLVCRSTILF